MSTPISYFKKILSCTLLYSMCSLAFADIALKLPDDTSLLALNGQSVIERNDLIKKNILTLQNGTHQLVINHTVILGDKFDEEEFYKTEVFALVFKSNNQKLTLLTPVFNNVSDIDKFNTKPSWKIIDSSGNTIETKISVLKKDGLQLSRNYEFELNVFNAQNEAASLPSLSTIAHQATQNSSQPKAAAVITSVENRVTHKPTIAKVKSKPTTVKNSQQPTSQNYGISSRTLIEFYQQASPTAQQEFIDWLQQ